MASSHLFATHSALPFYVFIAITLVRGFVCPLIFAVNVIFFGHTNVCSSAKHNGKQTAGL
jgi:hypothetical protein